MEMSSDTQKLQFVAEGGHRVVLTQILDGTMQAVVEQNLPGGFSRRLKLPASIQLGTNLHQLSSFSEINQRYRVFVSLREVNGFVFFGSRGLRGGNPTPALHVAVQEGNVAKMKRLILTEHVTFGEVDAQGQSALHCAVVQKRWGMAALMVRHGAKTDMVDAHNKSAVDYADQGNSICLSTVEATMQLFDSVDKHMETGLEKGEAELQAVERELDKVPRLLEALEGISQYEQVYREIKHLYHSTKASYLKVIGAQQGSKHQDELAQRYRVPDIAINVSIDEEYFANSTSQQGSQNKSQHEWVQRLKTSLQQLRQSEEFHDQFLGSIETVIEAARQAPSDYLRYCQLCADRVIFQRIMEETVSRCTDQQTSNEVKQREKKNQNVANAQQKIFTANQLAILLEEVRWMVCKQIDRQRLAFVEQLLICPSRIKSLLFSDLVLIEASILQRHKELARHFHPDKAWWLPADRKGLASDLMGQVNYIKDELLQSLKEAKALCGRLDYYEQQGNEMWRLAVNCGRQIKDLQLSQTNHMDSQSTVQNIQELRVKYTIKAQEHYRACCKLADSSQNLKLQIQFRGSLALTSYVAHQFLEAQLFALSAVKLIFDNSQHLTQKDFNDARKILDKVQGRPWKQEVLQTFDDTFEHASTAPIVSGQSSNATTVTVYEAFSFTRRRRVQGAVDNDLRQIAQQLLVNSGRQIVNWEVKEDLLCSNANVSRRKAASVLAAGVGLGTLSTAVGGNSIMVGVGVLGGSVVLGPIFGVVAGVATIGLGFWGGIELIRKGSKLMQEPQRREKLNDILQSALAEHNKGNPQGFLETLTKSYCATSGSKLFTFSELSYGLPASRIIQNLKEHGFRPDGIAFLLNLMGEALGSGKVLVSCCTTSDLLNRAVDCFKASLDQKLVKLAQDLDARIALKRSRMLQYMANETGNWTMNNFLPNSSDQTAVPAFSAQSTSFKVRLQEMHNLAYINLAISRILSGSQEDIIQAMELIQTVRNSVDQFSMFDTNLVMRLAAIEDFLWVVTGQSITVTPTSRSDQTCPHLTQSQQMVRETEPNKYLNYLDEQLAKVTSGVEKAKIYQKRANHYVRQAQNLSPIHTLDSLRAWQEALSAYASALRQYKSQELTVGYGRCLVEQSKYALAIEILQQTHLQKNVTACILLSRAQLKSLEYVQARKFAQKALQLEPSNQEAVLQICIVEKTHERAKQRNLEPYRSSQSICDETYYYYATRHNQSASYNILSLDGGGIRAVLPALWLSEIEFRAKRPISHLFDLIAGTSTGGIIAAGLSVPRLLPQQDSVVELCEFQPRHSALDFVDLYQKDSFKLFDKPCQSWMPGVGLHKNKSTLSGRLEVFEQYFHKATVQDALTELIIPAVYKENQTQHLFNRYDSRQDPALNVKLYDAVMATTAAPTFVPAHYIPETGVFLDGGVQFNNPSMLAYRESLRYGVHREIMMVSMGSGTCIPDPEVVNLYGDQLFWASENLNVNLAIQEGDVVKEAHAILKSRYQRWQVWLEEPIRLNAFGRVEELVEIGHSFLEEQYSSDANYMNKLLEVFDDRENCY